MSGSYRDLVVWQRAMQMTVSIYRLSADFPKKRPTVFSRIRRAAVSIASNIAEGYGRGIRGEYKQFLGMARGSNYEVQTQLVLTRELGYGTQQLLDEAEELSNEVGRMLATILKKLSPTKLSANPWVLLSNP